MAVINNNKYMLDRPMWEQVAFAPATGIAGSCNCDDNRRFIYNYFQISTTTAQFWRYDTWSDCWQQLASTPTQTGSVGAIRYVESVGGQFGGTTYGSVWLLIGNATVAYFYKYDIYNNSWSAMSIASVPATLGTDFSFCYPEPQLNNNIATYHSGVTKTITTSATVSVGATTISVTALPTALAFGTRLRFGSFNITLSAEALAGATTLSITSLPYAVYAGTLIETPRGGLVTVKTTANAGATSIDVYPIRRALTNGSVFTVERYVVLTASALANATSITVSDVNYSLESGATAYYYDHMYMVGNNATVMYRYQVSSNAWATTNASAVAIPAVTGAVGGGCTIKWLPSFTPDKLFIIRGNGTSNIYSYDLTSNAWATASFHPSTETFTTASTHTARSIGGKGYSIISSKDATMRIYEYDPSLSRLHPKMNQWLYPTGAAVQGDRATCLRSPDEVEFYYLLLPSSAAFVRCALIDS
jgi:hypothetical protein